MAKRIWSLVLTCLLIFSIVPLSVMAADPTEIKVSADNSEAVPGDTITYTVTFGAVENMQGAEFKLSIPEGLTYVPGSGKTPAGLVELLGAEKAELTEASMKYIIGGGGKYTSSSETVILTFQCTVNDDATGELEIKLINPDISDDKWEGIDFTVNTAPSKITVTPAHTCVFDQAVVKAEALKTAADCENAAVYYKSCTCEKVSSNDADTFTYGTPNGHSESAWKTSGTEHWKVCTVASCGKEIANSRETHADTDGDNKCDTCGYDMTPAHTCVFDQAVVKAEALKTAADCENAAVYYKSCTCEKVSSNDADTFTYGTPNGHSESAWKTSGTEHWKVCTVASCGKEIANSRGTHADTDSDNKCDICGYDMTPSPKPEHTHTFSDVWSKNETHHWHAATCEHTNEVKDKAAHTASEWIVDEKATEKRDGLRHTECTVCGYILEVESIPVISSGFDYDSWNLTMKRLYSQKFTITAEAGVGGSISNSGKSTVMFSKNIKYTITPDIGYEVEAVIVDGKNVGAVTEYTFNRVYENHSIKVNFREVSWDNPFTDIFETDEYYDAIEFVYENGLFNGVSESEFAPEKTMTRAMFVTVLGRLADVDADYYTDSNFEDVEVGTWYAPYVEWATQNGIVNGYGNGKFGVDDKITVEQAMVIMARYADYVGIDTYSDLSLENYFDADDVSDWAIEQMKWVVDKNIYDVDYKLNPQSPAKRSLVAEILYAFVSKFGK